MSDLIPIRPPLVRSLISSNLQDLNQLHEIYKWIPSSEQIRPNVELIEIKKLKIQQIVDNWVSYKDYILHHIFKKKYKIRLFDNLSYVDDQENVFNYKIFVLNEFPYNLEMGNHWVLWYGQETQGMLTPQDIGNDIDDELKKILAPNEDSYDFAWYINPKMSIPEFFHVQLFWTSF